MNINNVKNVLKIQDEYTVIFDPVAVTGFGNCQFATGMLSLLKLPNGYSISIWNRNEWGRSYAPHGSYSIIIDNTNKCIIDDDDYTLPFKEVYKLEILDCLSNPFGWTTEMRYYLHKLIWELMSSHGKEHYYNIGDNVVITGPYFHRNLNKHGTVIRVKDRPWNSPFKYEVELEGGEKELFCVFDLEHAECADG